MESSHASALFIYLEGTACTRKTSLLKDLQHANFPVVNSVGYQCSFNDLTEKIKEFPLFKHKAESAVVEHLYMLDQVSTFLRMRESQQPVVIFDRSPLASIAYTIVLPFFKEDKLREPMPDVLQKIEDIFEDQQLRDIVKRSAALNPCDYYIFFLNSDAEKTLQLMKKRDNKLDILSTDYVTVQNKVFMELAKCLPRENYHIIHVEADPTHYTNTPRCLETILKCVKDQYTTKDLMYNRMKV